MNHSCNKRKDDEKILFTKSIEMETYLVKSIEPPFFFSDYFFVVDTYLVALSKTLGSGFIEVLNAKTLEPICRFGEIGNGPGEFIAPSVLRIDKYNKNLWFIDFPKETFYCYSIKDLIKSKGNPKLIKSIKINHNLLVHSYFVNSDGNIILPTTLDSSLFSTINNEGDVVEAYGISTEERHNLPQPLFNYFYTKHLAYNPNLNVAICPYLFLNKILRYDFSNKSSSFKYGSNYLEEKPNRIDLNIVNKKNYYTIRNTCATNRYVFAGYLGSDSYSSNGNVTFHSPKEIHVFSWNLKPIVKLKFDEPVKIFDITEDGYMYVFADATENQYRIYKLNWEEWE